MTKAIVLGGSRGIGKAISDSLKRIEIDVFALVVVLYVPLYELRKSRIDFSKRVHR